jgi:RNA polymerase sigma factor (TIGR02999 family)
MPDGLWSFASCLHSSKREPAANWLTRIQELLCRGALPPEGRRNPSWGTLTLCSRGATFAINTRCLHPGWSVNVGTDSSVRINRLLANWGQGNEEAREALIPMVYSELRRQARRYLRGERPDHTLESAALVNEAYLRLVRQEAPQWQNRAHFFGVAAQLMRHILVDHARNRLAAKRGAGAPRLAIDPELVPAQTPGIDLVALDDALGKLAALDSQQARLIELRFFGGLSIEEAAVVLGVSPATVKREWATARAWLRRELKRYEGT